MCKLICLIYISLNFQKVRVENVEKILLTERPETFEHCVLWALDKYNKWFCNDIIQILREFPANHKDESTGKPFWSGKKRLPHPLNFDIDQVKIKFQIKSKIEILKFINQ